MNDENKRAFRDLIAFQIPILIWIITLIVSINFAYNYMIEQNIPFLPIGIFPIIIGIINLFGIVFVIKNHNKNL